MLLSKFFLVSDKCELESLFFFLVYIHDHHEAVFAIV